MCLSASCRMWCRRPDRYSCCILLERHIQQFFSLCLPCSPSDCSGYMHTCRKHASEYTLLELSAFSLYLQFFFPTVLNCTSQIPKMPFALHSTQITKPERYHSTLLLITTETFCLIGYLNRNVFGNVGIDFLQKGKKSDLRCYCYGSLDINNFKDILPSRSLGYYWKSTANTKQTTNTKNLS